MNFIKIVKSGGNQIRYKPMMDLTGLQSIVMISQYIDPMNALDLKIRKGESGNGSAEGEEIRRTKHTRCFKICRT